MNKFKNYFLLSFLIALPLMVKADFISGLNTAVGKTDISQASLEDTIVSIINGLLALVGLLFIIMIIYAGFKWMTAQGNAENVGDAKKIIKNSIIGITVILLSYTIVNAVYKIIMGQA